MDMVEWLDAPTSWLSPVLAAPEATGDIRLYVDMRKANESIIQARKPIPTIEEVLKNLNGDRMFPN